MKVWSTLALFVSLSAAAAVDMVVERREVHQPYAFGATLKSAPAVPEDAPADYQTALITLPDALASRDASFQRRDSRKPRGTIAARDFYECATSVWSPFLTQTNFYISPTLTCLISWTFGAHGVIVAATNQLIGRRSQGH